MPKKRRERRTSPSGGSEGNRRWANLDLFIQDGGDVTIGGIGPIRCAATAADDDNMPAALVRRDGESLEELLDRLDAAVKHFWEEDVFTDEING